MTERKKKTARTKVRAPRARAAGPDAAREDPRDRARRLLLLVPYVLRHPEGVPIGDLAKALDTTIGQVLADIELLSLVGPPGGTPDQYLDLSVERGRVRARVPEALSRPLRLTVGEAFSLLLGLRALAGLSGGDASPLGTAAGALIEKIRRAVGGNLEGLVRLERDVAITGGPSAGAAESRHRQGPLLSALLQRIEHRRSVELVYHSASRGATTRRGVDPYGLLNHGGSWYLVGRCHVHDDVRMFKLERVLELAPSGSGGEGRSFEAPADFDLERYRRDRLTPQATGEPVRVWIAGEAVERAIATFPRERLRQVPARGGVELTLDVPASAWLVGWLLALGPDAEALSPPTFRADLAAAARATLAAHED